MDNKQLQDNIDRMKAELADMEAKLKTPYPKYMKSIRGDLSLIIKFTSKTCGTVVSCGSYSCYEVGYVRDYWTPHTDEDAWEEISFDEKRGLYHKQLVWCWDDSQYYMRLLKFYNSKAKCTYRADGTAGGFGYDNYEIYDYSCESINKWAKEASKTLDD